MKETAIERTETIGENTKELPLKIEAHKDVSYYKGLLREYTRNLLMVMREDFISWKKSLLIILKTKLSRMIDDRVYERKDSLSKVIDQLNRESMNEVHTAAY